MISDAEAFFISILFTGYLMFFISLIGILSGSVNGFVVFFFILGIAAVITSCYVYYIKYIIGIA